MHDLTVSREPVSGLHTFSSNPRRGDLPRLKESLTVNGQYRPLVVNRGTHTGRGSEVLAGNHTLIAARELGWAEVAVAWVDVDEDHAARIVAADNRIGELGDFDDRQLAELLGGLEDLEGTGYSSSDLEVLVRSLGAPEGVEELAGKLGDGDDRELWPALRLVLPPYLHVAWRSHLDEHDGDEVAAFAAALGVEVEEYEPA